MPELVRATTADRLRPLLLSLTSEANGNRCSLRHFSSVRLADRRYVLPCPSGSSNMFRRSSSLTRLRRCGSLSCLRLLRYEPFLGRDMIRSPFAPPSNVDGAWHDPFARHRWTCL